MRLDQILVKKDLCESRQEAQEMIQSGNVRVNGEIITKQTRDFQPEALFEVLSRRKYVSRGGDKLEAILIAIYGSEKNLKIHFADKSAIDIGSSTGGFTDCLLHYGVSNVTAIDVGSTQLHSKLRAHNKVLSLENTDIRFYTTDKKFDIIVVDVSFISLEKILNTIISFGKSNTEFFILIKPQFEVGKGNTKKGIVKDAILIDNIIKKFTAFAKEIGLKNIQITPCKVIGGDGNQEYFLYGILK